MARRYVFGPVSETNYRSATRIPGDAPAPAEPKRDAVVTFLDAARQGDEGILCRYSVEEGEGVQRPDMIHVHTATSAPDLTVDPAAYLDHNAPISSEAIDDGEATVAVLANPPTHPGGDQDIPVWLVSVLEYPV